MAKAEKAPKFAVMKKVVTSKAIKMRMDLHMEKLPRNVRVFQQLMTLRLFYDRFRFGTMKDCTPCITDCVIAELEKLGQQHNVALRIAKDPRFERLPCVHNGTYAGDCIVERVTPIPGVLIMYLAQHKNSIEQLN